MSLSKQIISRIKFVDRYGDPYPFWTDAVLRRKIINRLEKWVRSLTSQGVHIDKIVGIEARGFIVGSLLAERLNLPFAPICKGGKLPREVNPIGKDCIDYTGQRKLFEVTGEHIYPSENVLIVDDWFETGAQARVAAELVKDCGAQVIGFCGVVDDTTENREGQKFFSQYRFYCVVALRKEDRQSKK